MTLRAAGKAVALAASLALAPVHRVVAAPAAAPEPQTCQQELDAHRIGAPAVAAVVGRNPVEMSFVGTPGREFLLVVHEQGNDVALDVSVPDGREPVHADNPVRRSGRQSATGVFGAAGTLRVRVAGKEHDAVAGRITAAVYDLTGLTADGACGSALRALAAGDTNYARGQEVSLGRLPAGSAAARHAYLLAAAHYFLAYTRLAAGGDDELRLGAAHALAALYYQELQDWSRSADWAARTVTTATALQRDYERARAQALLAAAWIELATGSSSPDRSTAVPADSHARFDEARTLLAALEQFHRRRGERYDAALQLNNIGVADLYEARFAEAMGIFTQAAGEFGALHERPRQGSAIQNVAVAQWGRGDLVAAVRTFREALDKLGPEPYPKLYLIALTNSALVNVAIGDFDEALRLNATALAFARTVGMQQLESQSLYGLGITYYALGDHDLAQRYIEASLALRPAAFDARGRVASLRALGTLYGAAGRYAAAIAIDEEALALSSTPTSRAGMLVRLAADKAATGRDAEALESLAAVLEGPAGMDPGPRIEALIERGRLQRTAGRLAESAQDLRAALALIRRHDSPDAQFRAELELARTLRMTGRLDESLAAVDRALARGDELRRQTANPEFRALRQEPVRPAFDLKVSLLAERYRQLRRDGRPQLAERVAREALTTAERGRARSLAELSASRSSSSLTGPLRADLARREGLYRDLAARRYRLADRENNAGAADLTVLALRADIASLRLELDTLNAQIARRTGSADGRAPFIPDAAADWLRRRAADGAIVEYWLGADEAYAWTITRQGIRWVPLGASAAITDAARRFHGALRNVATTSARERRELGVALYDFVVRPLREQLAPGRSLLVIPDGALHFIPFAALRTGDGSTGSYLIEERDVAVAPALWWLMAHRQLPAAGERPSRFLLVADPIYRADDARLTATPPASTAAREAVAVAVADATRFADLERLPWTGRETELVAALLPAANVDLLTGASATRARLLALDWARYRIIHLASHGMVDASMPQLSALVLGAFDERGQRVEQSLRVADLAALNLNAEVVALSACDTALGREIVGEGSMGLASTAIARGAGAVLASLWQAPDEMAARLMTEFYRGILIRRSAPAAALGTAMRAILAADREADPGLWAAFQLSVSRADDGNGPPT